MVTAVSPTASTTPTWFWEPVTGAAGYRYRLDDSSWSDNGSSTVYTPSSPLEPNTTHTLYVTAVDSKGRESESGSAEVYIDTIPPNIDNIIINNGNTYSCSPVVQVAVEAHDGFSEDKYISIILNGNIQAGTSPNNISTSSGSVTVTATDEVGDQYTETEGITLKTSSVADISLENQSRPSHLATSAHNLGNMSDYISGDPQINTNTMLIAGQTQNLWNEDWYVIYMDIGIYEIFLIQE